MSLFAFFYMKPNIKDLKEKELVKLVDNRYKSSETLWSIIDKTYKTNTSFYDNEPDWVKKVPAMVQKTLSNRITSNMESVINSVIANPPGLNFIAGRTTEESEELARTQERFFLKKYNERNVKEDMRMGLRNLYFGRLMVLKPFWNPKIDDFDVKAIDPRKVRFAKNSTKEEESEFAIEKVTDNLCNLLTRFPEKKTDILEKSGFTEETINDAFIENPEVEYEEAWIGDYLICKYGTIILSRIRNPYWDWDGLLVTEEEEEQLENQEEGMSKDARRQLMTTIKLEQETRIGQQKEATERESEKEDYGSGEKPEGIKKESGELEGEESIEPNEGHSEPISFKSYYFNYFDQPRKPYVFATILNNENQPIGRTDFITLSIPLQESIDRRKQDIGQNAELMNGVTKVESSVMTKSEAQSLAYQAKGIIYGDGVVAGVKRETGVALPNFIVEDMQDSRNEIDNIMAASSAFRGEREGQETKAGRLALIQQSFLRLNEMVQVVDYVYSETFSWFYQLAKTRYTERHYAKWMGEEGATKIIDLIQDDFETGSEIQVIPGKTLPVDTEFKLERAQRDVDAGLISPIDYMEEAGYSNARDMARNAQLFKINPNEAVGISPEEIQKLAPPQKEEKPPNVTVNYKDMPADAQVQLLAQIDIQANPQLILADRLADRKDKQKEIEFKRPVANEEVDVTQNTG